MTTSRDFSADITDLYNSSTRNCCDENGSVEHDWDGCVCKRCGAERHVWVNESACGSSACPRGGVEDWVLCGGSECPGEIRRCRNCGIQG